MKDYEIKKVYYRQFQMRKYDLIGIHQNMIVVFVPSRSTIYVEEN